MIDDLEKAETIYVYCFGGILGGVRIFAEELNRVGKKAIFVNDMEEPEAVPGMITQKDAAIISLGPLHENRDALAEKISNTEATTIVVSTMDDPQTHFDADHYFYTYPAGNDFLRTNAYVSQIGLLMGRNIILACLYRTIKNHRKEEEKE